LIQPFQHFNKLKTIILLIVIAVSRQFCFGQNFNWNWVKAASSSNVSAGIAIAHSPDSSFVYVGGRVTDNALNVLGLINIGGNGTDGYVAKYTSSGALVWSFIIESNGYDEVTSVAVDNFDNIFVGGSFHNTTNFQGTSGPNANKTSVGGSDVFVSKYNSNGILQWVTVGSSTQNDFVRDIKVIGNEVFVAGEYGANLTVGGSTILNSGNLDAFGMKLSSLGTLVWLKGAGSSSADGYNAVTVFGGYAYFGGYYTGNSFGFNDAAVITASNPQPGKKEGVLAKYNSTTGAYISHALITGAGEDNVVDMTSDGTHIFYVGYFENVTVFPGLTFVTEPHQEMFVVRCDTSFSTVWMNRTTTALSDIAQANSVDIDPLGNLIVTGFYSGTTVFYSTTLASNGAKDFIVALIDPILGGGINIRSFGGTGTDIAHSVSIKNTSEIYLTGTYQNTVNFTPISKSGTSNDNSYWGKYSCVPETGTFSGTKTICIGDSAKLDFISTGIGPFYFDYTDGVSLFSVGPYNTSTYSFYVSPTSTKTYSIVSFNASNCISNFSGSPTITVVSDISNYGILSPLEVCTPPNYIINGAAASGGGGGYIYNWEFSSNGAAFSSTGPATITEDYNGNTLSYVTRFRRSVKTVYCPLKYSDTVLVNVAVDNNSISAAQSICSVDLANLLTGPAPTTGASIEYTWEQSSNGVVWGPITGSDDSTQNFQPPYLTSSTFYRREITTAGCGDNYSDTVLINVQQPISNNTITAVSQTICSGTSADSILGSNPLNGTGAPYTYLWQEKTASNTSWTAASGINSNKNYFSGVLTGTTIFRRVIPAAFCDSSFSNLDTIYVQNSIAANTILSADQAICSTILPDTIHASLPSGGPGTYTYIWQDSSVSNSWTATSGVTADSMNYFPGALNQNTFYRRIIFDNVCGNDTSFLSSIAVDNPVLQNTITGDTTICHQTQPDTLFGFLAINGYGYSWEKNTDSNFIGSWTIIGASSSYSPGVLDSTTFYKRIVDGGNCSDDTSNLVTINVSTPIGNNSVSSDTTVCYGLDSLTLVGSAISGGVGNNSYLWESSLDNVTFDTVAGVYNQNNYLTGTITQVLFYRRRVINNTCISQDSVSNTILINVYQSPTASFDFEKDSICEGQNIQVPITFSGGAPFDLYMTYDSQPKNILGATSTSSTFDFTPVINGNLIIDSITDAYGCQSSITDVFGIRLIEQPHTNFFSDTSLCDSIYLFNPTLSIGNTVLSSPTLGFITSVFPYNYITPTFGDHEFILTETNEICFDSDTLKIIFTRPIGSISAGPDQLLNESNGIYLNASELIGEEVGMWEFKGTNGYIVSPDEPNSLVEDLITGINDFIWTVTNGECPQKEDTVIIELNLLYIPSGFSPNGDGNNDVFFVRGIDKYENIGLQIFNRWGNAVYSTKNYQNDWTGKLESSEDLPDDTYYFILNLAPNLMYKGYLVLKR
jgi:gliding motility-associated-like protein